MTDTTPFAKWRENGEPDPHGDHYDREDATLAHANIPSDILADMLPRSPSMGLSNIGILTAGKERTRWLSRKLYRLATDHDGINRRRAETLLGHYTDDEMANAFYLSEAPEELRAGRHRILWLLKEIKDLEDLNQ